MTHDQLLALSQDIAADPVLSALPMTSDGSWEIAEAYNAVVGQAPGMTMVSARTVLAELGQAGAIALDKLEAAGAQIPVVKWAMKFLTTDEGLDVGHPMSQSMLDQLAAAGVLTQTETDALKALALADQTRAEALLAPWRGRLSYRDIEAARSLSVEVA